MGEDGSFFSFAVCCQEIFCNEYYSHGRLLLHKKKKRNSNWMNQTHTRAQRKKNETKPNNVCIAILRLCGNNNNCCKWHVHREHSNTTHSHSWVKTRPLCMRSRPIIHQKKLKKTKTRTNHFQRNKTKQNILNYWSNWHGMALRTRVRITLRARERK